MGTSVSPCLEHPRVGLRHEVAVAQGLTLVHVRAQFEQLQDTFMS